MKILRKSPEEYKTRDLSTRLQFRGQEAGMENWKRALVVGASGASVIMFLKGRKAAGVLLAGVGLATLASEYPEKFAKLREELPDYLDRGTRFLEIVSRAGERVAQFAQRRGREAWNEIGSL
jgi:hypothetical protein